MNSSLKILTFSYDDGVSQDVRLAELFNKYGMKATFNINSGFFGKPGELLREGVHIRHDKLSIEDARGVYAGHEIASHSLTHPNLTALSEEEIVRQVEGDRLALSDIFGQDVVGFAYPGGSHDARVADILARKTGIRYARTVTSTHSFDEQTNLLEFNPTVYHHVEWDRLFALGEQFLALTPDKKQVFYVWGHAYEFDIHNTWDRFEEFLKMMSGREDIAYLTNREALLD